MHSDHLFRQTERVCRSYAFRLISSVVQSHREGFGFPHGPSEPWFQYSSAVTAPTKMSTVRKYITKHKPGQARLAKGLKLHEFCRISKIHAHRQRQSLLGVCAKLWTHPTMGFELGVFVDQHPCQCGVCRSVGTRRYGGECEWLK